MPQVVANEAVDAVGLGIVGNGVNRAYVSSEISTNNNKAVTVSLQIHAVSPSRQDSAGSIISFLMERKDDAGNWHPFHSIINPYYAIESDPGENGGIIPDHVLAVGPNLENSDTDFISSDGINTTAKETQKRGVAPSKVRFVVVVHERKFGTLGAFQNMNFSIDYELEAE